MHCCFMLLSCWTMVGNVHLKGTNLHLAPRRWLGRLAFTGCFSRSLNRVLGTFQADSVRSPPSGPHHPPTLTRFYTRAPLQLSTTRQPETDFSEVASQNKHGDFVFRCLELATTHPDSDFSKVASRERDARPSPCPSPRWPWPRWWASCWASLPQPWRRLGVHSAVARSVAMRSFGSRGDAWSPSAFGQLGAWLFSCACACVERLVFSCLLSLAARASNATEPI